MFCDCALSQHQREAASHLVVLQKSLRLTDQRKCELMELRRWILPRVGRLMRERERISKALQACTKDNHKQVLCWLEPVFLESDKAQIGGS